MTAHELLVDLLGEAYDRPSWHGPNLKAALKGVGAKQAAWQPGRDRPSIWHIALHAAYWKHRVWVRVTGAGADEKFPRPGVDWPDPPRKADSALGPSGVLQPAAGLSGKGDDLRMKIAVVTDKESAAGYRLAGLVVAVAANAAEAGEVLARLVRDDHYALIAVNEELLPDPYKSVKREMRGRDLPVLLPAPSIASAVADEMEDAEAYMRRLIVETMGYEIKI